MWPADTKYGLCAALDATFLHNVDQFQFETPVLNQLEKRTVMIARAFQTKRFVFHNSRITVFPKHRSADLLWFFKKVRESF